MSQSITGINPELLNPMYGQDQKFVPPLHALTQPLPYQKLKQTYYFVCSMLHHKMNRPDGKLIPFRNGMLATDDLHDVQYLANEMALGNGYIRQATEDEVRTYRMTDDPTGTVKAELRPQLEEEIKNELEHDIFAILETRMNNMGLTEEQKSQLTAPVVFPKEEEKVATLDTSISGVDAMERLKNMTSVKTGTATVLTPATAPNFASSISGTDKMANAADSNSGTSSSKQ